MRQPKPSQPKPSQPKPSRARSGRAKPREPRAHWILLLLASLLLLAELCFNGYVRHVGAEGIGQPRRTAVGAPVPEEASQGGPVLEVDRTGQVRSQRMPPNTVALTFDDGPDPQWTPRVLDVLRRHHAHGTFFVVGSRVNEYPELTRRILAEGHELGVHTFTHAHLPTLPRWQRRLELSVTQNAIAGATGRHVTLMRPPYSAEPDALTAADFAVVRDASADGYLTVLADRTAEDWRRPGVDAIVRAALPDPGRGAVLVFHDAGGDRSQTVAAVDRLLTTLGANGYRFPTVSEGLRLPPASEASATVRWRGTALRWAQLLASWLASAMTVLLGIAVGLAALRLLVQVWFAGRHVRRVRRRHRERLRYLGPVSVIVPAYNEAANIAATVRSLVANDYPRLEVVVVDDGSSDGTADIVERLRLPSVRVIRQANGGKPAALNTGIVSSRGSLLVLVDGDTVFEPDAVGKLVQPFADPDVGAVSGNTKVANRRGFLGRWQHLEYVIGFNLDRRMFDIAQCMPTVPGAIGAFRREALRDVNGVSAATLAEDTDLTMAVIRAGWRVVYEERAIAWTEVPATLRQLWRQRYRWCYGTMQAMWKHRRALVERDGAGKLGRRGLAYLLLFQVLLPLTAPAVDAYAVYGLLFLPWLQVVTVMSAFLAAQALTAMYALKLDRERFGPLWALPFQQLVYRQLMYLVVVQSTVAALVGSRQRWHGMARTGAAREAWMGGGDRFLQRHI
jgi:cellulose synthase/poly-beta-1,6-N-acetylglucosamine synthase-like glycosyltransferase/peptidoglycan/xylan/chitin deacetylase (PgdA/CDA1 family)